MRTLKIELFVVFALTSSAARAQFANNTVSWNIPPTTQAIGSVSDNLQLSSTFGIDIYGTWSITLGPGFQSGTLLEMEAVRLMQTPAYGPTISTSMSVPGVDYITRPFVNSVASGTGTMQIDGIATSLCGWTFSNSGSGQYLYNNGAGFISQSGPFLYNGGTNRYMRLKYSVDFNYNGPGGTYFFTFPLHGELVEVPEPATLTTLIVGVSMMLCRRRPSVS
jgi:hypothetical protein